MNPNIFRLALVICAAFLTLGYLSSVDVALVLLAIILALVTAALWLCGRVARWCWRRWSR